MRFPSTYQVAIVALISLGATALAQQPGQPGQPGGRGGRGGPPGGGGGFFPGGMGPRSRLSLLSIPEIRKELELADEQVAEIEKVAEEIRDKYSFGRGPGGGGPGGRGPGGRGPGGGEGDRPRRNDNEGAQRSTPASWFFVVAEAPEPARTGTPPRRVWRFSNAHTRAAGRNG